LPAANSVGKYIRFIIFVLQLFENMPNAPMVIDLFSGVGGLSLSAAKSGFYLKAAVEYEPRILSSHAKNFPNTAHICADVSSLTGKSLAKSANVGNSELAGLIGGPPCQGFSTIGIF
jgi:DNA (cytosine-5)-methyltransferase 1